MRLKEFNEKWKMKAARMGMTPETVIPVIAVFNDFGKLDETQQELMEGFVLEERINRLNAGLQIEIPDDGTFEGMSPAKIKQCKDIARRMGALDEKQMKLYGYILDLMEGKAK